MERPFLNLDVYRIPQKSYYTSLEQEIDHAFDEPLWRDVPEEVKERSRKQRQLHQYETLGPWEFNEIVGFIRLYFCGTQVRGEYFSSEKTRTRRTRKKVFTFRAYKLAAEVNFRPTSSSEEIYQCILKYVERCKVSSRPPELSTLLTSPPLDHTPIGQVFGKSRTAPTPPPTATANPAAPAGCCGPAPAPALRPRG